MIGSDTRLVQVGLFHPLRVSRLALGELGALKLREQVPWPLQGPPHPHAPMPSPASGWLFSPPGSFKTWLI